MTGVTPELVPLFGPGLFRDPYPAYAALRESDPVHWEESLGVWILTRYDDVVAALDDARLGSDRLPLPEQVETAELLELAPIFESFADMMLFADAPKHTRLRRLVSRAFTPAVVEQLRPWVEREARTLLAASGSFDVIRDLAYPLPTIIAGGLFGIPTGDRARFRAWWYQVSILLGDASVDGDRRRDAVDGLHELADYLRRALRAAEGTENVLGLLASARHDGATEDELVANCILLLSVGQEAMTNAIGNGTLTLLRHREQLDGLRERPALLRAVEELLRYETPIQFTGRRARESFDLRGRSIAAGDVVLLHLGAANRDPAEFAEPDRLDLDRRPNRHLAFAHGPHFCLGAALGRLQAEVVFTALLPLLPRLRLETDEPEWIPNFAHRGLRSLPVTC